jgi:hypothetical protein
MGAHWSGRSTPTYQPPQPPSSHADPGSLPPHRRMDQLPQAVTTYLFSSFDAAAMKRVSMLSKALRARLLAYEERTVQRATEFAEEQDAKAGVQMFEMSPDADPHRLLRLRFLPAVFLRSAVLPEAVITRTSQGALSLLITSFDRDPDANTLRLFASLLRSDGLTRLEPALIEQMWASVFKLLLVHTHTHAHVHALIRTQVWSPSPPSSHTHENIVSIPLPFSPTHTYTHTHTHTHTQTHTHTHTHTQHKHKHTHTHTHTRIHTYTHKYQHQHCHYYHDHHHQYH